jgi:hypothetical protein
VVALASAGGVSGCSVVGAGFTGVSQQDGAAGGAASGPAARPGAVADAAAGATTTTQPAGHDADGKDPSVTADGPVTTERADVAPAVPPPDATSTPASDVANTPPAPPVTPDAAPVLPPPVLPPPVLPPSAMPPPPAPAVPRVLRVHDVTVDRLKAAVVYSHKLDAKSGTVGGWSDPLADDALAAEVGPENVKGESLEVDVLYAHDIHAKIVEITEAHVSMPKVGEK